MNRTVGQIYALLFVSDRPLNAEEITESLGISRSNTSMGLKELESWRLVRKRHVPGDRRDYFSTPSDVWEILRIIAEERRRREVDPTMTMLRDVLMETPVSPEEQYAQARMSELLDQIELLTGWAHDVQQLPNAELLQLLKMGAAVSRMLELKGRIPVIGGRRAPNEGSERSERKGG